MQAATEALWPWLVVAGMGAVHGLNPASGWAIAAAWGLHARSRPQAWWALLPIALGHAASVALVAIAVVYGLSFDGTALQLLSQPCCSSWWYGICGATRPHPAAGPPAQRGWRSVLF